MKKKILALAVIVVCLSILAATTFAYFTETITVAGEITSGAIEITVVEKNADGTVTAYATEPISVMPTQRVGKAVAVRSEAQAAYVRMRFDLTVLDSQDREMDLDAEALAKVIAIIPDAENWTQKDGWWYYARSLSAGDVSAPLFEEIVFSGPNMGNDYQNCTVLLHVTAQAVQSANNGTSALDALGWPAAQ